MGMLELQTAVMGFFRQACPNVFLATDNPVGLPLPRITIRFDVGEFNKTAMWTYQIWVDGRDNAQLLTIADKILKIIPMSNGFNLIIPGETIFEYKDRLTGQWIEFDMADFDKLFDPRPPNLPDGITRPIAIDYRETVIPSQGGYVLRRGTPFNENLPSDDVNILRMLGNIEALNLYQS